MVGKRPGAAAFAQPFYETLPRYVVPTSSSQMLRVRGCCRLVQDSFAAEVPAERPAAVFPLPRDDRD